MISARWAAQAVIENYTLCSGYTFEESRKRHYIESWRESPSETTPYDYETDFEDPDVFRDLRDAERMGG